MVQLLQVMKHNCLIKQMTGTGVADNFDKLKIWRLTTPDH